MIYILLLLCVLLTAAISYLQKKYNKDKLFLLLSYVPIVLVMGLRSSNVGKDTLEYLHMFRVVGESSIKEILFGQNFYYNSIEKGYLIWSKIISLVFVGEQSIVLANSMLIIFLMFIFFKRNSYSVFLSVFLFLTGGFYFISFNVMRQVISIGFLINSLYYFDKKQYIKTFFLFLLAISFHMTSIIFVFAYVLRFINLNKKKVTIILFSIIIVSTNYIFFISKFTDLFPKFEKYTNNKGVINTLGGIIIFLIIDIIIIYLSVYVFKWKDNKKIYFINIMAFIYVVSLFIGNHFNYFDRIALIFRPYELLIIPLIISKVKVKYMPLCYFLVIVIMSAFYVLEVVTSNQLSYSLFWSTL